jgi:hypothetical protein
VSLDINSQAGFELLMNKFNMRGKFGLIIHWIGFVLGLTLSGGAVLALRGFATVFVLVPLVMILFLIPNTLTWGIRRVIVGGNGFFPWQVLKKNGELSKT